MDGRSFSPHFRERFVFPQRPNHMYNPLVAGTLCYVQCVADAAGFAPAMDDRDAVSYAPLQSINFEFYLFLAICYLDHCDQADAIIRLNHSSILLYITGLLYLHFSHCSLSQSRLVMKFPTFILLVLPELKTGLLTGELWTV